MSEDWNIVVFVRVGAHSAASTGFLDSLVQICYFSVCRTRSGSQAVTKRIIIWLTYIFMKYFQIANKVILHLPICFLQEWLTCYSHLVIWAEWVFHRNATSEVPLLLAWRDRVAALAVPMVDLLLLLFLIGLWLRLDPHHDLLQLLLKHVDVLSALGDAVLKGFFLLLTLLHCCAVWCWLLVSNLSQLVAKLLLSLHHLLQGKEYGRRLVEEVVLCIKPLVLISECSASGVQLINCSLHLVPLKLRQRHLRCVVTILVFTVVISSFSLLALEFD